jgi:transcriptional regulator with XRE-family HTH domain
MAAISEALRHDLQKPEFSEGYAESFLDSFIATQLKVLREQNGWSQQQLAEIMGKKQTVISRSENVSYSSWNISTLKQYARAFRLRLRVSFETYGSLIDEVAGFSKENLQRIPRESDPALNKSDPRGNPNADSCTAAKRSPLQLVPTPAGINAAPVPNGNENPSGLAQGMGALGADNSTQKVPPPSASSQANVLERSA